jgi:L-threonylcarbamoyladenylate synthase
MNAQIFPLSQVVDEKLKELGLLIKQGQAAVIPTDTIYGIVGSALNVKTVERIYNLRRRASSKPMIILIESEKQISELGVKLDDVQSKILSQIWPNPLSIVIDVISKKLHYLHRGKNSLAFRIPDNRWLLNLLKVTGPIVAPSANFEGEDPAKNIIAAKNYFKDSVSFYIDAGDLESKPSTVAKLDGDKLRVLREGAVKVPEQFLK